MPRLVIKSRHHKDTCYDEIGICAHNIDTSLVLLIKTIGKSMRSFNEQENLHFDILYILHLDFNPNTSNNNLHNC